MGRYYPAYDDDGSFIRCYVSSDEEDNNYTPQARNYDPDTHVQGWCEFCNENFYDQQEAIEHKQDCHDYCVSCDRLFRNANGLRNHFDTAAAHMYGSSSQASRQVVLVPSVTVYAPPPPPPEFTCSACYDQFYSFRQLEEHRLSYHPQTKNHACPFCSSRHASLSAVTAHLESGGCRSGANRTQVDEYIFRASSNNNAAAGALIRRDANPPRHLEPLTRYQATSLSLNSHGRYECYFCPGMDFALLQQLNQHLESPKHSRRAPGMYKCPGCRVEMQTLSGLIQHAEMGSCGVRRDRNVQGALEGLTNGMRRLGC